MKPREFQLEDSESLEMLGETTISTGLIVRDKSKRLVFLIDQQRHWDIEDVGGHICYIAPFGGIGGKVRKGETPYQAVWRELMEETIGGIWEIEQQEFPSRVFSQLGQEILWNKREQFPGLEKFPIMVLDYRSPQVETNASTLVYIYKASVTGNIFPSGGHPALLHIPESVLTQLAVESRYRQITVVELINMGAELVSTPNEDIQYFFDRAVCLKPIGTALLLSQLIRKGSVAI